MVEEGGGSLDVSEPRDPAEGSGAGGLTSVPFLVKVDRYGSVSGLSRVETPLGYLVIVDRMKQGRSIVP